ncbi:MAG: hypothetical protein BMS9Abin05_1033 [Rhodothermia bacterium]|nr:MAG: hypothetical protein BMS9Abin05_1033 [Rhodothermia bacterium]
MLTVAREPDQVISLDSTVDLLRSLDIVEKYAVLRASVAPILLKL